MANLSFNKTWVLLDKAREVHGSNGASEQVRQMMPYLNFDHARFPILGGLLQRRGGTAGR